MTLTRKPSGRAALTPVLAVIAAAIVGGACGIAAAAPAAAVTVPLVFDFGVVLPGASADATQEVTVARDSIVSEAVWTHDSGPTSAGWDATICSDAGACRDFSALRGAHVKAGTYTVTMTVTMPVQAQQGEVAVSHGNVQLVEESDALAVTGGSSGWPLAIAGAAIAGSGALLLVLRRRKERER